MPTLTPPAEILAFWEAAGPSRWFASDPLFDAEISIRFSDDVRAARETLAAGPHPWEAGPRNALALMLLTDQFPRNIYRGLREAWSGDALARQAAGRIIAAGLDRQVEGPMRVFFYLPFTHSEDIADHDRCVALTEAAFGGESAFLRHARAHRSMVGKFGRFPARNAILGRASTPAEQAWLGAGGYAAELEAAA